MGIKVIITGVTGMVGEGVLLKCLESNEVDKVLSVSRKHYDISHPKLTELIITDFLKAEEYSDKLKGYDACFFCAGVSSVGKKADDYKRITYDTTMHFAKVLSSINCNMVFDYVSGKGTDSTEKGKLNWARVKGKTENDLMKLPFKKVYNFRPGMLIPFKGQKNFPAIYEWMAKAFGIVFKRAIMNLGVVGQAMINSVTRDFPKQVLETPDIWDLSLSIKS